MEPPQTPPKQKSRLPGNLRLEIIERDKYTCQKCYFKGAAKMFEVHHINMVMLGGTNDPNNLITLCSQCHKEAPNFAGDFDEYVSCHYCPQIFELIEGMEIAVRYLTREPELLNKAIDQGAHEFVEEVFLPMINKAREQRELRKQEFGIT